ncbi:hypothetical protein NUITMVRA1_13190 [Aerococcus viridans]|uniref:hypothetical protein n=1 Tax=Aerococcus viridans TaxID=1377 RepID=UPI0028FD5F3D|nr:hypothetical protein NUITMVRA1_13190 [Aerococcus viridans]
MTTRKELTKEQRIRKEFNRLKRFYKALVSDEKLKSIDGLMQRAAYLRVTLEDMEADLDENGFTELFSQSENQSPYERERPTARLFNTLTKNYQSAMTQLNKVLPDEAPKDTDDGFDNFVSRRDDLG